MRNDGPELPDIERAQHAQILKQEHEPDGDHHAADEYAAVGRTHIAAARDLIRIHGCSVAAEPAGSYIGSASDAWLSANGGFLDGELPSSGIEGGHHT